jgi:hypothetical protein
MSKIKDEAPKIKSTSKNRSSLSSHYFLFHHDTSAPSTSTAPSVVVAANIISASRAILWCCGSPNSDTDVDVDVDVEWLDSKQSKTNTTQQQQQQQQPTSGSTTPRTQSAENTIRSSFHDKSGIHR